MSALRYFRYNPDPLTTRSIVKSDEMCVCCRQARGYIHTSASYGPMDYLGGLCPWCIADGSAHAKLGAIFTAEHEIGGHGKWDAVSPAVIEEIAYRTPGFSGWQQERWWTHCHDWALYLGPVEPAQLEAWRRDVAEAVRDYIGFDEAEWERFGIEQSGLNGGANLFIFLCRHCGAWGAYVDWD